MAEDTNPTTPPELVLEEVVELEPDALSDEQKTFLEAQKENLTPEQVERFGIKPKEEAPVNPDEIEIETRGGKPPVKKEGEETEEEDEIDPDDAKTIAKVVRKEMAPYGKIKDEVEVDALIRAVPEYSKYRAAILKYMDHPAYKNIPAHNIAAIVSAKDMQKIGAQKEREAAAKAKETQGGGSTARTHTGKVDWSTVSKEDFEAQKARVLGRQGA